MAAPRVHVVASVLPDEGGTWRSRTRSEPSALCSAWRPAPGLQGRPRTDKAAGAAIVVLSVGGTRGTSLLCVRSHERRVADRVGWGSESVGETAPHVLYVEDDTAVLELGVNALEEGGFSVTTAVNAAGAIRQLEAEGPGFIALITDIDLPGGADGWSVARRARELFPNLPVVYVSGASAQDWASRGVPGSVMLTKPYALAQLVVAVSNATLGGPSDPGAT